jgi:pseudouridine-5'-phosphate glycosidase
VKPRLNDEVSRALERGAPVVALESTLVAHGLPAPDNLRAAREMEAAVRRAGAVPATVAVLGGRLVAGLGPEELERLADPERPVLKLSTRDLPAALARGNDAATTVAATMVVAAAAGIRLFATGGIGGVHRGSHFDVSADLLELSRTPVAVVCSGAKSILDLPRTLEALEALSVPVIGFGTDELPAFYTPRSGCRLTLRSDAPEEVARILTHRFGLAPSGGALIANPIPEAAALDPAELEDGTARALARAQAEGVTGAALTPFLLAELARRTGGRSVAANTALATANAALAARIAVALAALRS